MFLEELKSRGLFHQCTNELGLRNKLLPQSIGGKPLRAYIGFDPTSDSLTIGNFVQVMLLGHWQRAGGQPVVVMGGGTGLIGDPSGKSAERQLRTREEVEANVRSQRRIFGRVLELAPEGSREPGRGAIVVNNLDWLGKLSFLDALRDIGKHFSVNVMIQKDSVRERLHNREQGISYTEFSYQILQAYDFLHLFRDLGVVVQMGGSDQWGNIVAGCDLVRRLEKAPDGEGLEVFGVTTPLVTKADGTKFGKTESGAVWVTADRTSPYAFYQFWLNAADADVVRFLNYFTFLPRQEIDALAAAHAANPGAREAHRALARSVTELLHGRTEMEAAEAAARALFSGEVAHLPLAVLEEAFSSVPSSTHDKSLLSGQGTPLLDVLAQTSLAKSKTEARQHLSTGAVSVNGQPATMETRLNSSMLLHGKVIALRRGKKAWHITRWE